MIRLVSALTLAILATLSSPADALTGSMRCGSDVLTEGMTKVEVLQKCGEPLMKDVVGEETVYDFFQGSGTANKVVVEQWIYDSGKGSFLRVLIFKGGTLSDIEYGNRQ